MNKLLAALSLAALPALSIAAGAGGCSGDAPGTTSTSTGIAAGGGAAQSTSTAGGGGSGSPDGGVEGGVSLASFSYKTQGTTIVSVKVSAAFAIPLPSSPSPCTV